MAREEGERKGEQHEEYLVGGKAKASTTKFYRIASWSWSVSVDT